MGYSQSALTELMAFAAEFTTAHDGAKPTPRQAATALKREYEAVNALINNHELHRLFSMRGDKKLHRAAFQRSDETAYRRKLREAQALVRAVYGERSRP